MKYGKKLWLAGMIMGFVLMVVIGYAGIGGSGVLAGDAADVEGVPSEGYSGSSPCPGNCAVCGLCTPAVVLDEEIEVLPVNEIAAD